MATFIISPILPTSLSSPLLSQCSRCRHCHPRRRHLRYNTVTATVSSTTDTMSNEKDNVRERSTDDYVTLNDRIRSLSDRIYNFLIRGRKCGFIYRGWREMGGNYVRVPSYIDEACEEDRNRGGNKEKVKQNKKRKRKVKAVIHFLGGGFVGAAPQLFYQSFLERLCEYGYIIVATPYDLSFNYMKCVDLILDKWDRVEVDLALEYGPLPIIGLGHSAGALLHTIVETLFERQYGKAGNILVSFSNRTAKSAVPLFEEVVGPLIKYYSNVVPENIRKTAVVDLLDSIDGFVTDSPFTPTAVLEDLLPVARSSRAVFDQITPLFEEVGIDNVREFRPTPDVVASSINTRYEAPETLIVRFRDDPLDESERLFGILNKKSSDVGAEVSLMDLAGSHVTPLTPDLPPVDNDLIGMLIRDPLSNLYTRKIRALETVINEWIDAGLKDGKL